MATKKIQLKGEKVVLRPLSLRDAPTFCEWLKDTDVTVFLDVYDRLPPTLKAEREWIAEAKKRKDAVFFAIDTIDGEHIGTTSLMKISTLHKHAEYGIFIGNQKYWGQGYGTEAGKLILDYGFNKLKLHRIFLRVYKYNIRGQKSYEKIGFKKEGILRQHRYRDGHWHDEVMMGILKEEFLKQSKTKKRK